jgi:hypothetical protein
MPDRNPQIAGARGPVKIPGNADFVWESFDSAAYLDHNYKTLRADDSEILGRVRDHFADHFAEADADGRDLGLSGGDVGAGPNLYPALSLLPWCDEIELVEYSLANCAWLRREVKHFGVNWDPFWELLRERPAYAAVADPRQRLAETARVVQGSALERGERTWDIATMFFVAESISGRFVEFRAVTAEFVRRLRPGAPFAAAFMEGSIGLDVGNVRYAAVPVGPRDVADCLAAETSVRVERISLADNPLRQGYTGMLLALGTKTRR